MDPNNTCEDKLATWGLLLIISNNSKGLHLESFDWGFAFGISSKVTWTSNEHLLLCIVQMEDSIHRFMQYLIP